MAERPSSSTLAERVGWHRRRIREHSPQPDQPQMPDSRSPEFAAEAHRQAAVIAQSAAEFDDQSYIDAISDSGE